VQLFPVFCFVAESEVLPIIGFNQRDPKRTVFTEFRMPADINNLLMREDSLE
jgi:hypothetical protein